MRILAIETSCDDTAISIVETKLYKKKIDFKILGNEVSSQIALHTQYGGVFPMMAKREHGKNILSVLEKVLRDAKMYKTKKTRVSMESNRNDIAESDKLEKKVKKLLDRENEIQDRWMKIMPFIKKPKIDTIAVTTGPGLEPALWVGISFAKALSVYWDIPIVKVNHMEGHVFSIFPRKTKKFAVEIENKMFPMLSLLVSGGHTELVLLKSFMKYKKIGETRDDAAGEAFDKVARMMGLPYPGGPEIGKLAYEERSRISPLLNEEGARGGDLKLINHHLALKGTPPQKGGDGFTLPRPMIYSKDYDFSFSGLKTAVLYLIRDLKEKNPNILEDINIKQKIACEFENALVETLVYKTIKAIKQYKIKTLIVGGGVSANIYLQEIMNKEVKNLNFSSSTTKKIEVHFPTKSLTGDNALMIAIAGYFQAKNKKFAKNINKIKAEGNLSL